MKNVFPFEGHFKEKVLSEEHEYCTFEDQNLLNYKGYQLTGGIFKLNTEGAAFAIKKSKHRINCLASLIENEPTDSTYIYLKLSDIIHV